MVTILDLSGLSMSDVIAGLASGRRRLPEPIDILPDLPSRCVMCGNKDCRTCSSCNAIYYCSDACQKEDQSLHEIFCQNWIEFNRNVDLNEWTLGLVFEEKYKVTNILDGVREMEMYHPCFLKAHWDSYEEQYLPNTAMAILSGSSEPDQHQFNRVEVHTFTVNPRQNRDLGYNLHLHVHPDGFPIPSKVNESIFELTGGCNAHAWKGPVALVRSRTLPSGIQRYESVRPEDFRHVFDIFLAAYPNLGFNMLAKKGVKSRSDDEVWGLKLACDGEQRVHGTPACVRYVVPKHHGVFAMPVSETSKLVGFPVRGLRLVCDKAWSDDPDSILNAQVEFLFRIMGRDHINFGSVQRPWMEPGNTLIVRADGKDLHPLHFQLLSDFCRHHISSIWNDTTRRTNYQAELALIDDTIKAATKQKFINYIQDYKRRKVEEGGRDAAEWASLSSPFKKT